MSLLPFRNDFSPLPEFIEVKLDTSSLFTEAKYFLSNRETIDLFQIDNIFTFGKELSSKNVEFLKYKNSGIGFRYAENYYFGLTPNLEIDEFLIKEGSEEHFTPFTFGTLPPPPDSIKIKTMTSENEEVNKGMIKVQRRFYSYLALSGKSVTINQLKNLYRIIEEYESCIIPERGIIDELSEESEFFNYFRSQMEPPDKTFKLQACPLPSKIKSEILGEKIVLPLINLNYSCLIIGGKLKKYYLTLDTSLNLHSYEISSPPEKVSELIMTATKHIHKGMDYF